MKNRAIHFFFFILFCFLIPSSLKAENYKVGIGIENRFINQNDDGSYTGFEIDLWKEIAKQLKIEYSFQKEDLFPQLLDQLKKGEVDFGIWMMSMNRERADYITYSYPYFVSEQGERAGAEGFGDAAEQGAEAVSADSRGDDADDGERVGGVQEGV